MRQCLQLLYISQHHRGKFVTLSDSLSVLTTITNHRDDNILIKKNSLLRLNEVLKTNFIKQFFIPSHVGIRGNERVDALPLELKLQKNYTIN